MGPVSVGIRVRRRRTGIALTMCVGRRIRRRSSILGLSVIAVRGWWPGRGRVGVVVRLHGAWPGRRRAGGVWGLWEVRRWCVGILRRVRTASLMWGRISTGAGRIVRRMRRRWRTWSVSVLWGTVLIRVWRRIATAAAVRWGVTAVVGVHFGEDESTPSGVVDGER